jgi:AcrR family transcriptional regulator
MAVTRSYRSPRRAQEAATTRGEILAAARALFVARGYARVTVADIAERAGTAVKTVYASAGGKAGILTELLSTAVADSGAERTLAEVRTATDLAGVLTALAGGTRRGNEANQDAIMIMYSAMSAQDDAERVWAQGTSVYRETLREVAAHIDRIGALPAGVDVHTAGDLLWFCFGTAAWRTLVGDCGWSWDDAERTLLAQARTAFTPRAGR